jgi:hypothetical protein
VIASNVSAATMPPNEDRAHRGIDRRRGRRIGDLEVDDFVREPFLEACDTLGQVSPRLVLWVGYGEHADFGQRMLEDGLEVRGERP